MINCNKLNAHDKVAICNQIKPIPLVKGERLVVSIEAEDIFNLINALVILNVQNHIHNSIEIALMDHPDNPEDHELMKRKHKFKTQRKVSEKLMPKIKTTTKSEIESFLGKKRHDEIWRNNGFILPNFVKTDESETPTPPVL